MRPARPCKTLHTLAVLAAASCASGPEPIDWPTPEPSVRYAASATSAPGGAGKELRLRWFATRTEPRGLAVSQAASAILADRGEPFRGRTLLPIGSRWLSASDLELFERGGLDDPMTTQVVATASAVLAPGLVTVLEPASPPLPGMRLEPSTEAGEPLRVLLEITADADGSREAVLIDDAMRTGGAAALFVPVEALAPGGLLVAITSVADANEARVAAARAAAAAAGRPPAVLPSPRAQAWALAGAAVGARNRRPALLALVAPLQLQRATDMLLVADEPALAAVTPPMTATDADSPGVSWALERALWQALLPRMERDDLTPAMRAAASRNLGAASSDTATLRLLLETSGDGDAFTRGLREANIHALDDHRASDRAAALRFLAARGSAPDGYEVMMDRSGRRRVVRRLLQALEGER